MVVEGRFQALGKTTRKEVITFRVKRFGAVGATDDRKSGDERKAQFSTKEDMIFVGRKAMISEAAGKRMQGDTGGEGEEGR